MISFQHALANIQNSTPPPKHMTANKTTGELSGLPKEISLERLVSACKRYGADVHDVIAEALTPAMRENEKSGMTMRAQAELAWKIVDKAEPSQQAVKHSGDPEAPFVIQYSEDERRL